MKEEIKISKYDVAEHLRTPQEMAAYLEACFDEFEGDETMIIKALGDIARAKAMTQLAYETKVSKEKFLFFYLCPFVCFFFFCPVFWF